jgi:DNA-binding transcriptional LysR family regulator
VSCLRLEQLKYFETLVQEGSYTKAAEQLHISQPSLTASIKALEKEFDTPLLIRDTRNFAITEEGKKVLTFAKETLASYQALFHSIKPAEDSVNGDISIVASKFFCEIILEQFLPLLRNHVPGIRTRLLEQEYQSIPTNFSSISFNFIVLVRLTSTKNTDRDSFNLVSDQKFFVNDYQFIPLFTDPFGFCTSKSSILVEQSTIYPDTIDTSLYHATTFPFGLSTCSDDLYLVTNNPNLHIEAMLQENAFCNIPHFVYHHIFAHEKSLTWRAYSNNMTIEYYLAYPAEHILTTAEQIFIDELQNYLTQQKLK